MRPKQFRTPFVILISLFVISCGKGPIVDVCLSYPDHGGFICVDQNQKPYFIPYAGTSKYVCFSPPDAQKLIEACGIGQGQGAQVVRNVTTQIEGAADGNTPVRETEAGKQ